MDDSSVSSSKVGAHTSGQWEVDGKNEDGGIDIVARPTGCVLPWLIAMTATSLPVDEANARLIAAAPELAEALRDVLRIAKAASIGISGNAKRIARAEAALAKLDT